METLDLVMVMMISMVLISGIPEMVHGEPRYARCPYHHTKPWWTSGVHRGVPVLQGEILVILILWSYSGWWLDHLGPRGTQDGGTILGLVVLRMVVPSDLHHTQDGDTSEPGHTHGLSVLMLLLD